MTATPDQTTAGNENEIVFDEKTQIKSSKNVFDLASKEYVQVVKIAPKRTVENMEQFVALMNNDAKAILQIVNDGLESYDQKELAKRTDVPVYVEQEDGSLEPYAGETLTEGQSAKLSATVLALAKNLFGYAKAMDPDVETNRKKKSAAKKAALDFMLSNPATIEMIKAQ